MKRCNFGYEDHERGERYISDGGNIAIVIVALGVIVGIIICGAIF